jgi:hypothetical protein
MDERLLIQLSAYADGELDPRTRADVEQQLAQNPQWQSAITQFKQLDALAAKLQVPDATQRLMSLFDSVGGSPAACARELNVPLPSVVSAQLAGVPAISASRYDVVWKSIAQRTAAREQSDRAAMHASARADGEHVNVGADSVSAEAASARDRAVWKLLDATAARLPVPQLSADAEREAASEIAARIRPLQAARNAIAGGAEAQMAAPQVSKDKWDGVWKKIEPKVSARAQAATAARSARVATLPARHRSTRWRWMAGTPVAIAALVTAALLLKFYPLTSGPVDDANAWDLPKSVNDRYDVTVEYVKGDPVVCYYLKPEDRSSDANRDWRWLPD